MKRSLLCHLLLASILSGCSAGAEEESVTVRLNPSPVSTPTAALFVPSMIVSSQEPAGSVTETINTPGSVSATGTPSPEFWKDLPIVPSGISDRARIIYQRGLEMGNNPHAFSKIGDCHSTNPYFLADYDLGEDVYELGEYASLQPTIDYFGGSFSRSSLAAKKGLSTAGVLASLWADWKYCSSNETPLDCEFRLHHPSFALVSLGTNEAYDVKKDPSTFEGRLRRIIEHSIDQGIVPILSTKADNDEGDHYINSVTARLAVEYELPLWNFWLAVQSLPQHGLRSSDHLTFAPTKSYTDFSRPEYLTYGMQVRNLTALQVLDLVRRDLAQPTPGFTATSSVVPANPLPENHQPGETILSSVDGMELVYIPAGSFNMGSESRNPNEIPAHTVSLDGYWLDHTEITNEKFVRFLNAEGNQQEGGIPWLDPIDPFVWVLEKDGIWQTMPGRENFPITKVSWYGAKAYCQWAGRDLPTEAQWEYAAAGTDGRRFPWGAESPDCTRARFSGCGNSPVEAGSLLQGSSPFGILELAGNVAEWVNDRYAADYYLQSPAENPPGPINGYYRVIRGGFWGSTYLALQTSHRGWAGADAHKDGVGFRCALTP